MSSSENPQRPVQQSHRARNLSGLVWSEQRFVKNDFSQVQANQSNFTKIQFDHTPLHAIVIREAHWDTCHFESCVGRFVEVESSNFTNSEFTHCTFEDGSFYDVTFDNTIWKDSGATGSDFRYSSFKNATLTNLNLNNCDLAHVDFTGCTFENVSTYNARITNAIGLSPEIRDQLLAGGAYEGLPPTFNKLRKKGLTFQRSIADSIKSVQGKFNPTTWIDTTKVSERIQTTFQEWKAERQRQQEELQRQEDEWKKEQEKRRLKSIEERKAREERRRQEKEAQRTEREQFKERRRQEQEIQDLLQSQTSERTALEQEIQTFFDALQTEGPQPEHLERLGSESTYLYQQTEAALEIEKETRAALNKEPLNKQLQETLKKRTTETQQLAQDAMNAQQKYFQALQDWKRKEADLLDQLQKEALQRSTQLLIQNRQKFELDLNIQEHLDEIEAQGRRNLLKAQLEHERDLLEAEMNALENEDFIEETRFESPNKQIEDSVKEDTTTDVDEDNQRTELDSDAAVDIQDLLEMDTLNAPDSTLIDVEETNLDEGFGNIEENNMTPAGLDDVDEEYISLFNRVSSWLFTSPVQNTETEPHVLDEHDVSDQDSDLLILSEDADAVGTLTVNESPNDISNIQIDAEDRLETFIEPPQEILEDIPKAVPSIDLVQDIEHTNSQEVEHTEEVEEVEEVEHPIVDVPQTTPQTFEEEPTLQSDDLNFNHVTEDGPVQTTPESVRVPTSDEPALAQFNDLIKALDKELDHIEQIIQEDTPIDSKMMEDLKRIQHNAVQDILTAELEENVLSKDELNTLQSSLITQSLLSFKSQLEDETRLEQKRQAELERQQFELEEKKRLRADKLVAQQREKEQEAKERKELEQVRAAELDRAHKEQLKAIIEKRYTSFSNRKSTPTVKEVEESFVESFEFEESGERLKEAQQSSILLSVQELEAIVQKEKEQLQQQQLEQERLQRKEKQRQAEQEQQKAKALRQREEEQRQELHKSELRRQAQESREKAIAEAKANKIAKRQQINVQKQQQREQQLEQERQRKLSVTEQKRAQQAVKERLRQDKLEQRKIKEAQKRKELEQRAVDLAEQKRVQQEAKARLRQDKLEQRKIKEAQKRKELEQREQQRELRRLETMEKEQQARIERKKERLSSLKSQLLEEARRQEYQELSAQIEADIEVQQSQILERQRKQQVFLEQVKAEQERRSTDPLLLEQQREQELFTRKQERLERLQDREREIQSALISLQAEYEKDKVSIETNDLSIQMQGPLQQRWYRLTDAISSQSPAIARSLDGFKEQVEELYISRQAQARFEREQQKKLAASALEEKRRQEHQSRLKRLAEIRSKEEKREARLLDEADRKARLEAEATRQRERLALTHIERHNLHRSEAITYVEKIDLLQQDLRGQNHTASRWINANAQRALLSGTRLEAANLIGTDFSLALLDYAILKGASLDEVRLDKSNLEGATLLHASLKNAHLRLTRMYDADLRYLNAQNSTFESVDCSGSRASNINLQGATLHKCTFVEMNLRDANFEAANLEGTVFTRSDLSNANLKQAIVTLADFRGVQGINKESLLDLERRGALINIEDATDRYGTFGAPQLRVAIVLFALGVGSILVTQALDGQQADLETLEAEAQALRDEDAGLASERYEQLAANSQILDEQVQYYIEAATLAEQNGDLDRSEDLFKTALVSADLNTELNTKVGLRFAQFLLSHSKPQEALQRLQALMDYQSLSTFQRAKLIFYTEQSCEILGKDSANELSDFYAAMNALPEVQADLHMALSDLRLQYGQTDKALEELNKAEQLVISDGLALRLIESKARAHDRLGNLPEAIEAYEALRTKATPDGQTAQTATLALADLWRREGDVGIAMNLLETLTESASNDGRLRSRSLLIQGRLLEEQDNISDAATKYKEVLNIQDVEPETLEESRVSLARLLLQNNDGSVGDLPPEILSQARLGEARTILDQGDFEASLEMYSSILQSEEVLDGIRRAAESGMAEALSNLGKHQEANEIWERLLRENLDPVESQHIEVLLAYSKLQANDLDGARLAFTSLQQSNDALIRYQGLMGDAQTSVLAGELERAKEAYQRILQSQPSEEIQIQVWQELAQIAQEQSAIEDVLLSWQNILRFGVDDEALRSEAHTSIARALAQMDRLEEAISECELNLSTAESQLQCAMILEMAKDPRAVERYTLIAQNERVGDVLRSEAALGAAKLLSATERSTLCVMGLSLSQIDPIVELQLIQLYLETPVLSVEDRTIWQTRQQTLAQASPEILVQYLMERTSQLRIEEEMEQAIVVMTQGLTGMPETYAHPLRLELADMLLESGQTTEAIIEYQTLIETDVSPRLVRSGLARAYMLENEWKLARDILKELSIDLVTGTEVHMMMEINQMEPTAEGLEIANQWATQASNPDVQWEALMTQAHTALGDDNPEQALALFTEAHSIAIEPRQQQWSQLGKAQVQSTLGNNDNAEQTLQSLETADDNEVLAQYHIQLAQLLLSDEQPEKALASLEKYSAQDLGPGWDMTVEELRVQIYGKLEQFDLAHQQLIQLENRWPNEEQVQIPSAIAKVQLLQQEGDISKAQMVAQASLELVEDPVYKAQLDELLVALQ